MITLLTLALADLPPPPGTKRVPYRVVVDGVDPNADSALVVYPWTLSNGAPSAEIGVVGDAGLRFGRRQASIPAFWLVPKARLKEATSTPEGELEAWMKANATTCSGDIDVRSTTTVGVGPDEIVDTFTFSSNPCALELKTRNDDVGPAEAAKNVSSSCGCTSNALPNGWGFSRRR